MDQQPILHDQEVIMNKHQYIKFSEVPIYNNKGKVVAHMLVDNDDHDYAMSRTWRLNAKKYACYSTGNVKTGTYKKHLFHRIIMNVEGDLKIDHVNRNTLDNRKSNLRVASDLQNQMNKRGYLGCSSKFKGVTWDKQFKKWAVRVMLSGKQHFVGRFKNEKEAGRAYNKKSKELFGDFAYQNKI